MEKVSGKSLDLKKSNIDIIQKMFPEVITEEEINGKIERKIDFDKLRLLLGDDVSDREERYELRWNGKNDAIRFAQTPSNGTLRPDKESSKNWDDTENLYIEGDNLEVLKLLQKSYFGRIKMIYIDPPYNTGKDFVYKDDFRDNVKNYLEQTGQATMTNTESNGRYHTDWLNMMYSRLKLARNLLSDEGVLFMSIDDNEVYNLKKISDELFGEDNFINSVSIKMKNNAGASGGGEDKRLKKNIEYILIYAKNYNKIKPFKSVYMYEEIGKLLKRYKDENRSWKYTSVLYYEGKKEYIGFTLDGDGNEIKIYKRIEPIYKSVSQIAKEENCSEEEIYYKYFDKIFTTAMPQSSIRVRVMEKIEEIKSDEDLHSIEYVPKTGKNKGKLYEQYYKGDKKRLITWFKDVGDKIDNKVYKKEIKGTYWDGYNLNNLSKEGNIKFENGKKPLDMLKDLLNMCTNKDDIILDFFSGSATTAHAVMQLNTEDGGNRKFIMVQLPEITPEKSEARKAGYENICEIGKERICRAGEMIVNENKDKEGIEDLDIGFKVFKLDSSNIKEWDGYYENLEEVLEGRQDIVKSGRTNEDLLYEIIIKMGIELTAPIEEIKFAEKTIYNIGMGALLICLEDEITEDLVAEIPNHKSIIEDMDTKVVFKESGFRTDSAKMNAIQKLKQFGITDVRSV